MLGNKHRFLHNQIVFFFFGNIADNRVGVVLQRGKFFVAAQVVFFGKAGGGDAVLLACFQQFGFGLLARFAAEFAARELLFELDALPLQGVEFLLLRAEFFLQGGFNALRGLGFGVNAPGVYLAKLSPPPGMGGQGNQAA